MGCAPSSRSPAALCIQVSLAKGSLGSWKDTTIVQYCGTIVEHAPNAARASSDCWVNWLMFPGRILNRLVFMMVSIDQLDSSLAHVLSTDGCILALRPCKRSIRTCLDRHCDVSYELTRNQVRASMKCGASPGARAR
jgi:hypothetical protein